MRGASRNVSSHYVEKTKLPTTKIAVAVAVVDGAAAAEAAATRRQ